MADIFTSADIAALSRSRKLAYAKGDVQIRKGLIAFEHNLLTVLDIITLRLRNARSPRQQERIKTPSEKRQAFVRESVSIMAYTLKYLFSRAFGSGRKSSPRR